jgi:hypothetical protein
VIALALGVLALIGAIRVLVTSTRLARRGLQALATRIGNACLRFANAPCSFDAPDDTVIDIQQARRARKGGK